MSAPTEKLAFQPPHALNPSEAAFIEALPAKEKELHIIASQMLGSSYFVGKTHAYNKWKNSQTSQDTQPPTTK